MKNTFLATAAALLLVPQQLIPAPAVAQSRDSSKEMADRFKAAPGVTELKTTSTSDGGLLVNGNLDGRAFAVRFPHAWNEQAVLFAHGYVSSGKGKVDKVSKDPVDDDDSLGLMPEAYRQGFAVGHTAFDRLGLAVESGVERNVALQRLLRKVGADKVYMTGGSMGGSVTALVSQRYPAEFDGALAVCGVVSDWTYTLDYVANVRILYNYFSRGTPYELPGSKDVTANVTGLDKIAVFLRLRKLQNDADADPTGPAAELMARTMSAVPGMKTKADFASISSSLLAAIAEIDDIKSVVGGMPADNSDTVYHSELLDEAANAALNRGVQRVQADRAARARMVSEFSTSGDQRMKLLTIHNAYDPFVAYEHEQRLRQRVEKSGNLASLAQQTVPTLSLPFTSPQIKKALPAAGLFKGSYGALHCGFNATQMAAGFNDLIAWTQRGIKPTETFRTTLDR